jgi:hypothetical protein
MTMTTGQALKEQREKHGAIVPSNKAASLTTNGSSPAAAYLATHGVGMTGIFFKFAKDGVFRQTSDDKDIPEGTIFRVIYDQIQVGWIKFMGKGNPPERRMGGIFQGHNPPKREELGDTDQAEWDIDEMTGRAADPWQFQILVPMQRTEDGELFVFQTTSITGRRACDNLISACIRMQSAEPDCYPLIKLRVSGFQHKNERIGWVKTPAFERVGKSLKADATVVQTSVGADLNDEIPW